MGHRWLAAVCLVLAMAAAAAAQPSLSGFVALDAQNFLHPPTFPQQESHRVLPSLLLQPEFYYGLAERQRQPDRGANGAS